MAKQYASDLTKGSVAKTLVRFMIPIMLSNYLQALFNTADTMVVGKFAINGAAALAAVGSTTSLVNLMLNLVSGFSLGTNIVCARHYGARDEYRLRRTMHTAIALALVGGAVLALLGWFCSRTFLGWMSCPKSVIDLSTLYMRIYFLGAPVQLLYNFGAAILRSYGDTKRPMYILTAAGILNVLLNLIFVLGFQMDVAGVAIATVASQALSAFFVLRILFHPLGEQCLSLKEICIDKRELGELARVGVPSGINSAMFNIANVTVQSTINSFGEVVVAGSSAAHTISNFVYQGGILAITQASASFAGQNHGAKNYKRVDRLLWTGTGISVCITASMGAVLALFPELCLGFFTNDPAVIAAGAVRARIIGFTYFMYSLSEICGAITRSIGHPMGVMLINIFGICGVRLLWIKFVFPLQPTPAMVYLAFPVSWIVSSSVQLAYYKIVRRKIDRQMALEGAGAPPPTAV